MYIKFLVPSCRLHTRPSFCPTIPVLSPELSTQQVPGTRVRTSAWGVACAPEVPALSSSVSSGPAWTQTLPGGVGREAGGAPGTCPPRQERFHCVCLLGMTPSQPTLSRPTCPPRASPSRTWHPSPWSPASSAPEGPTLPWAPKDLSGVQALRGGPSQLPCVIEKATEAWRRRHRPRQYGKWGFAGDPVLVSE